MLVRASIRTSVVGAVAGLACVLMPWTAPGTRADAGGPALTRTAHPPIPRTLDDLWLVPADARPRSATARRTAVADLAQGVELIVDERFAEALPRVKQSALAKTPLADYASYYTALAQLRTGAPVEARAGFRRLNEARVPGVVGEWALLGEARAAEQTQAYADAVRLFSAASERRPEKLDEVLSGLARNQLAAGDRKGALGTYRQIYFGYPLSAQAEAARQQLATLAGLSESARVKQDFEREVGRAERLFGARRYAEALASFEALAPLAGGDDREKVALRIAESQFYLGQFRQALDGARPFAARASRRAEARFFVASSLRGLGDHAAYVSEATRLVADVPDSSWSEEALNNLATHYILVDDDAAASEVFGQYLDRFPRGRHAARAAWKLGWWRYRQGQDEAAITIFERASANFPRSDYRPAWLYWTARAYERQQDRERSAARDALVAADYLHSYYGRLSEQRLASRDIAPSAWPTLLRVGTQPAVSPEPATSSGEQPAPPAGPQVLRASGPPPTADRIRHLITAGLFTTAVDELRYAQRTWGTSAQVEATLAWLFQQLGDYRRGINAMKRAYPQYLSDEGQQLPREALRVIFPLDYWALIRKHAAARDLDPFLVAALVAQESSFDADVRSSANAYGLMQIVPATGRRLARSLGIKRFATSSLTHPETNVRLGTLYFKNLVAQFGGTHYALASYNAGENRVVRWIGERGKLSRDEFIDDIPFPETQNYVKKILGTAEDYRRLYGAGERGRTGAGN